MSNEKERRAELHSIWKKILRKSKTGDLCGGGGLGRGRWEDGGSEGGGEIAREGVGRKEGRGLGEWGGGGGEGGGGGLSREVSNKGVRGSLVFILYESFP